jgi:cbb3-type cytochrome oxidase maturation protein
MYYPYFMTYMAVGLGISLVVFFWALNNGQFRDQQRARYLPLHDVPDEQRAKVSRFGRYETYALFFLAAAGIAASAAVLIFALYNG